MPLSAASIAVPIAHDLDANSSQVKALAADAVALAREWVDAGAGARPDAAALRLAGLLRDPAGLDFTLGFIDGVVRPQDNRVAARELSRLSHSTPGFLAWPLRAGMRIAGVFAPLLPGIVVPIARAALRLMVRHLIIDARPAPLGKAISRLRAGGGIRLNMNLLGEAILGNAEAARRLQGTRALIEREDVDYVSIKVSSTVAPHSPWAFDDAVADAVAALAPLLMAAKEAPGGPTFVNLDMEEYRDVELTLAVFTTLLDQPELAGYHAGIVLQAYLPDALGVMMRLQAWAAVRVEAGGAPIKVRVVKGANLPMERVDADAHDWPLATWGSKIETDANYKAVLAYALTPERTRHVRIGVAGQNAFDIALAWELAGARGVREALDVEMLIGMAPHLVEAVRRTVGEVLLYTPVVRPQEFDVAIAYLIRRLEEGASQENFMSVVFDLDRSEFFDRERDRFLAAVDAMPTVVPTSHRLAMVTARNEGDCPSGGEGGFANAPDTDPSVPAHIEWAREIRARVPHSTLGITTAAEGWIADAAALDRAMDRAKAGGLAWGARPAIERADVLRAAADELERRRADLIEVAASECGKVLEQTDPEVSEAVDFARYYATRAELLGSVDGATFECLDVTVVTPPWNFPIAIAAGGVLAALAAGSAVVLKPAEPAHRCGAVVAEALWAAGVPRDALVYARVDELALGRELLTHAHADQVILTGAYDTARLFRSFDPSLRLFAETSGKNAIIVTPSADLDLAAKDVAYSAFGHAGQKCSAASLVVLVGSVATSQRFLGQLTDAAASLRVGWPQDASSQVGPLIAPAAGTLLDGLTVLGDGQRWLLEPHQMDATGRLWSPGIRAGVRPGSAFHRTEYFGPVLGVMTAATLDEAIEMVNAVDYGLTSGLHSLDGAEVQRWMARIEAGNLYVNRAITGAIVQRQPFGGWRRSAVGTGTKAGGPHYVAGLGRWVDAAPASPGGADDALAVELLEAAQHRGADAESVAWLRAALAADAAAWAERFGVVSDATGLEFEHNALRYQAVPVTIRMGAGAGPAVAARILGAGLRTGARLTVSSPEQPPEPFASVLRRERVVWVVEGDDEWVARVREMAALGGRIRIVGEDPSATVKASGGSPALAIHTAEPVSAGEIEMLPYLREQAVSVTAHRFGTRREYAIPALARATGRV